MNQIVSTPEPGRVARQDALVVIPVPKDAATARVSTTVAEALASDALRFVRTVGYSGPDLLRLAKELRGQQLFHVVMEGHVDELKKAGNGLLRAWCQDANGKITEQALLREVVLDPASLAALSDLATKAMLVELAMRIDAVHADVRRVGQLLLTAEKGRLRGAIVQYSTIQSMKDTALRRDALNSLALATGTQLRTVIDMLKNERDGMPEPRTRFFRDAWAAPQQEIITARWKDNARSLALVLEGVRVAVLCHLELGERAAAMNAFEALLRDIEALDLTTAASKARIARYDADDPPEAIWEASITLVQRSVKRLSDQRAGTLLIGYSPELLGYDNDQKLQLWPSLAGRGKEMSSLHTEAP